MEHYKNLSLENIVYLNDEGIECIETWGDISNHVGIYTVSDLGRVKSLKREFKRSNGILLSVKEKIRRQVFYEGYLKVKLKNSTLFVHRLVAIAFIPNPENKPEVNHKKGATIDNRRQELEWADRSENCQHAYDTGLNPRKTGIRNPKCKLNDSLVLAIRRLYSINNNVSLSGIAKKLNIGKLAISRIIQRKTWTHI